MPWPKKSEDHKQKLRDSNPGVTIESYNLKTGETIKIYTSISEVEQDGFSRSSIYHVLNGERQHSKGLGWRHPETNKPIDLLNPDSFANQPFE